jgi:hypothetical protein
MDDVQPQPPDLKAYADRLEILCRAQADEINRLRDELARATEGAGALATLQSLYRNGELPESLRAKCAGLALSHESAPLKPVSQLELKAEEPIIPLADLVRRRRARADALRGLDWQDPANAAKILAWCNRDHTDEPPSYDQGNNNSGDDTAG